MNKGEQKGITLVSLIVTIIVLLIFLAVMIDIVSKNNGVEEAKYLKRQTANHVRDDETLKNEIRDLYRDSDNVTNM